MDDTSPEIKEKMIEMIQAKTPEERAKMGSSMYDTARALIVRAILEENPDISLAGLRQQIFLKFYGDDFDPATRDKILQAIADKANSG